MENTAESASIRLLIHIAKQYTQLCHSLLSSIQNNEQLSVEGFSQTQQAKFAITHLNRSMNMLECLIDNLRTTDELQPKAFEVIQMTENLCRAIEKALSSVISVSIQCTYDLSEDSSVILIDKTRFEAIIYNLLYYCLNGYDSNSAGRKTIKIRISEENNTYIFRISSTSPEIQSPFDRHILNISDKSDIHLTANRSATSLLVAKKLAENAEYRLKYYRSKRTNVYEVVIPQDFRNKVTTGISFFEADITLILEAFSDIFLNSEVKPDDDSEFCEEYFKHPDFFRF